MKAVNPLQISHSHPPTPVAGQARRRRPGGLSVTLLCLLFGLLSCGVAAGTPGAKGVRRKAPKVTDVKTSAAKPAGDGSVSFTLTVTGEGFGKSAEAVSLALLNADGADAVIAKGTAVGSVEDSKIVYNVVASTGPYSLRLKVGNVSADTSLVGPVAVAAQAGKATPQAPASIVIETPEAYPYQSDGGLKKYRLVVKWKGGEFFGTDPKLISLVLTPADATDINVRRVTPTRIEADFWGPDKFEVKDASVTVFDPSNPQQVAASSDVRGAGDDTAAASANGRMVKAGMSAAEETSDAAQPEITSTAIVFLQRAYGIGRLKVEGKNFGSYEAPPVSAENYLLCFEPLARQALVRGLQDGEHPNMREQQNFEDQRCNYLGKTVEEWNVWRAKVEKQIKVSLVPRNTDLRIEQIKVLYADDNLIDVYFEFNRYFQNSEPLRLASVTVTVKKPAPQPQGEKPQTASPQAETAARRVADGPAVINAVMGGVASPMPAPPAAKPVELKTYIASREVGESETLRYTYNVLDDGLAAMLFGKGVSQNFYAILLSVTNEGDKKVAIPRTNIRAEIEWAYGPDSGAAGNKSKPQTVDAPPVVDTSKAAGKDVKVIPTTPGTGATYYEEGPATLAPLSLETVTAFFDGDEKVNGKKAKWFNYFDGAAIFGSSLLPFFGQGFKDAHGVFTGGFMPGLKRGLGDLSGQQLQYLTGMSWQDVEVVAGKGGSVSKYVFIQRGDSKYSSGFHETVRKTIKNIEGMEVKGVEVVEGETKTAAPTGQ